MAYEVPTPKRHHILGRHARGNPLCSLYVFLRIFILVVLFDEAEFVGSKLANEEPVYFGGAI